MTDNKSVAAILDAINNNDFRTLLSTVLERLGQAGPDLMILAQQALTTGFALGRAEIGNQDIPPQAQNFLNLIAGAPVAPEAFRMLREGLGVSQTDISKLCGVTQAAVSEWERGEAPMPGSAVRAMIMIITKKKMPIEGIVFTGADLRALRKKLGMRQKDLALALGVSLPAIAKWEGQPSKPLAEATIERIKLKLEALQAQAAAA